MVLDWRAALAALWLLLTLLLGVGLWHYHGAAVSAQRAAEEAQQALSGYKRQVAAAEAVAAKHRTDTEVLRATISELASRASAGHGSCGSAAVPVHVTDILRKQAAAASAHP